jgi:hypothetical protein
MTDLRNVLGWNDGRHRITRHNAANAWWLRAFRPAPMNPTLEGLELVLAKKNIFRMLRISLGHETEDCHYGANAWNLDGSRNQFRIKCKGCDARLVWDPARVLMEEVIRTQDLRINIDALLNVVPQPVPVRAQAMGPQVRRPVIDVAQVRRTQARTQVTRAQTRTQDRRTPTEEAEFRIACIENLRLWGTEGERVRTMRIEAERTQAERVGIEEDQAEGVHCEEGQARGVHREVFLGGGHWSVRNFGREVPIEDPQIRENRMREIRGIEEALDTQVEEALDVGGALDAQSEGTPNVQVEEALDVQVEGALDIQIEETPEVQVEVEVGRTIGARNMRGTKRARAAVVKEARKTRFKLT